jgi:aminomethyltransferase
MVEFAGFLMPIEYSGLIDEHLAVRNNCGVFDVSHMGEILITGTDAREFVDALITNAIPTKEKRMAYALMCHPDGGIVDDLMTYYYNDDKILLVVNASNLDKDLEWINEQLKGYNFNVNVRDISDDTSLLALQGPNAVNVLQGMTEFNLNNFIMFDFDEIIINGKEFLVSRSGYTGEDGFEIYGPNNDILELFKVLVKVATPCGLGCRDTLRFEANLPLYGHEIDRDINPLEATLGFAVDLKKNFIGSDVLKLSKENGLERKVVGLELLERGIARSGYDVEVDGNKIGYITTGYMVPGTEKTIALAMLDNPYWEIGQEVCVRIRKNLVKAVIRNKRFLNKKYQK